MINNLKNNFFSSTGFLHGTGLISANNTILDTTGNIGGNPYFVDTTNRDKDEPLKDELSKKEEEQWNKLTFWEKIIYIISLKITY